MAWIVKENVPVVSGRHFAALIESTNAGRCEHALRRAERAQIAVEERRPDRGGRVSQLIEDVVALEAVIECTAARA